MSSASELGEEQFRELVKEHPSAGYLDKESIRDMPPEKIVQVLTIAECFVIMRSLDRICRRRIGGICWPGHFPLKTGKADVARELPAESKSLMQQRSFQVTNPAVVPKCSYAPNMTSHPMVPRSETVAPGTLF
jgi:hypothetical protein